MAPFFFVWLLCLLAACTPSEQQFQFSGPTMGTSYHVSVIALEVPANLDEQIAAQLDDINRKMSTYIPDSELMRLNRAPVGEGMQISPDLMAVLTLAEEIYSATDGAFDPSVGPLVNLWGFGPDYHQDQVPDYQEIAELRAKLGFDGLDLDQATLTATRKKDISIDLSAIAKGYAADRVGELLASLGIHRYMVEVGGELALAGLNSQGTSWKIAIEKPTPNERNVQSIASFTDVGVATSGDYRNYFEKEGRRYSHTIDPRTGFPIDHNLASVTVVAATSARADGLATAFMVMGTERALAFAEEQNLAIMTLTKGRDGFESAHSVAFAPYLDEVQ